MVRAPDLDRAGLKWFNIDSPLSLTALRGRLVILDFWTFCCINCMHVVPILRRIEETLADQVTIIGVHSPKFRAERNCQNLQSAIRRYGIRHPVVHDPEMVLWDQYAVRAWPTLVFIDPGGRIIGHLPGEPDPDLLLAGIQDMLQTWRLENRLKPGPPLERPPTQANGRALCFPGKIKRLPEGGWVVADAGHHQIALYDQGANEIWRVGSGCRGYADGMAAAAMFDQPQGLVATERAIFVADTGNHAIRRIDRATGRVETLAGVGLRGLCLGPLQAGAESALASVWDLEHRNGQLWFANAGTHQIGVLDLASGLIQAAAGTGEENIVDGPADHALLAQPSGLALSDDGSKLYFTDAETSAVRLLDLNGRGRVETLVGAGLFDYGDRDGPFEEARLQHPLGLACWNGGLVVADSYNGSLRFLDLQSRSVSTLMPPGLGCNGDATCLPGEPAGVITDGPDGFLVSDTNNHRILSVGPNRPTSPLIG